VSYDAKRYDDLFESCARLVAGYVPPLPSWSPVTAAFRVFNYMAIEM